MLLTTALSSLAVTLSFLSSSVSASPASVEVKARSDDPGDIYTPVEWTNTFPTVWCSGEEHRLSWFGGSGRYNVDGWLKYPNLPDWHPAHIVANTTERSFIWTAPQIDDVPENSTYTFSIQDVESEGHGDQWFQVSPELPIEWCATAWAEEQ